MAIKSRISSGRRSAVADELSRLRAQVAAMDKQETKSFVNRAVSGAPKIALLAFNKHIATELQARLDRPGQQMIGSSEQEAIWDEIVNGSRHVMVNAVVGSGKTTVLMQACHRVGGDVHAMTYHSLGFKACARAFGKVKVEPYKVYQILDAMKLPVAGHLEKMFKVRVNKVVGLSKQYGKSDRAALEWLVDHHDVELNGMEELVLDFVPGVLKRCTAETSMVDFDDMIWLPYVMDLPVPEFDLVLSDEAQDLNVIQQYLALKAGNRHVVVGDPKQSIYGFRGADSNGMRNMKDMLDSTARRIVELPLTLTRWCPKSHVALAQRLVPQIRAMDNAPVGVVQVMGKDEAVDAMRPGDMVLCRVNAELLMVAYRLLRKGVKAVVRGKDIGQGIVKLIDKACGVDSKVSGEYQKPLLAPELIRLAGELTNQEVAKFMAIPHGRGEMRASAAQDKFDCLVSISDGAKDSWEVKKRIEVLFADFDEDKQPKLAVVLSTVHRGKGLEASRVFILRPDLMPHPAARQEHDVSSELNLAYVAVTRCKHSDGEPGTLVWVGQSCGLFGDVVKAVKS